MSFISTVEMIPGDWTVTFDLAISFNQLGFSQGPDGVSKYFCFETVEGDVYEYLVGVMGWCPMAELMDVVTKIARPCHSEDRLRQGPT